MMNRVKSIHHELAVELSADEIEKVSGAGCGSTQRQTFRCSNGPGGGAGGVGLLGARFRGSGCDDTIADYQFDFVCKFG